jgi:hypothetical protein
MRASTTFPELPLLREKPARRFRLARFLVVHVLDGSTPFLAGLAQ